MKLKKEFASFYQEIRIDSESHALKEKREILENDIKSNLPDILSEHGYRFEAKDESRSSSVAW